MKIASIILNTNLKELDKEFDYIVPEEFDDLVERGKRVIVPFGLGNKLVEGLVLNIKEYSGVENELKKIYDILDENIIIDDKTIEIAIKIKERYLCTLFEAIKLFLPPNNVKTKIYVKRFNFDEKYEQRYEFLRYIENEFLPLEKIEKSIGYSIKRTQLLNLYKKGLIEIKETIDLMVKPKKELIYSLVDINDAYNFIEVNKNSKRYEKHIWTLNQLINNNGSLSSRVLKSSNNCSSSVLNTLINRGLIKKEYVEVFRNPYNEEYKYNKIELNLEQKKQ